MWSDASILGLLEHSNTQGNMTGLILYPCVVAAEGSFASNNKFARHNDTWRHVTKAMSTRRLLKHPIANSCANASSQSVDPGAKLLTNKAMNLEVGCCCLLVQLPGSFHLVLAPVLESNGHHCRPQISIHRPDEEGGGGGERRDREKREEGQGQVVGEGVRREVKRAQGNV